MNRNTGWKAVVVALGMASTLYAAEVTESNYIAPKSELPRAETTTQATAQATVQKIDYKTRMITLKNEAGEISEMKVGPEVVRFEEIKKGDNIVVDYLQSTALYLHKPEKGETPSHTTDVDAARLNTASPAGAVGTTERISAEVVKVDYKNRKITLKGPEGRIETMNVPPEVKRLNEIKKGDHIVAEHTINVVMAVRKP